MRKLLALTVPIVLLGVAGCGGDATPAWEKVVRDNIDEGYEEMSEAELFEACTLLEPMTDAERRQTLLLADDEDDGEVGPEMSAALADEGLEEPTREMFERGYDLALERLAKECDF